MNKLYKSVILAVVAGAILAGCKTTDDNPGASTGNEPVQNETPQVGRGPGDQDPLDPTDFRDPRNLTNPSSPLSKRVIYFDFDQSTIRPEYREIVEAHATHLGAHRSKNVVLEGHADERGTREYNLGLGERRGNGVSRALDASGASSNQISVVSYGEERPALTCSDEGCWSQNRRVEIVYR